MKRLLLIAGFICCHSLLFAQGHYNLKVGEHKFISLPDPPQNGVIQNSGWGCNHADVTIKDESAAGAMVVIEHYFDGTAQIEVFYNYLWYDNYGNPHVNDNIAYFQISCNAQYATLSDSSLTLDVGESTVLSVQMSGYGGYSPKWRSTKPGVASVNQNGNVNAISAGSATIICDPIIGPEVSCNVKVNSSSYNNNDNNDDNDNSDGEDSGNEDLYPEEDTNRSESTQSARRRIASLRDKSKEYL